MVTFMALVALESLFLMVSLFVAVLEAFQGAEQMLDDTYIASVLPRRVRDAAATHRGVGETSGLNGGSGDRQEGVASSTNSQAADAPAREVRRSRVHADASYP